MKEIKDKIYNNKIIVIIGIMAVVAIVAILSVAMVNSKSELQNSNTQVLYCKDCSEETKTPTKFCSNCGKEASWVTTKPEKIDTDEIVKQENTPEVAPEKEKPSVVTPDYVNLCSECGLEPRRGPGLSECETCFNKHPDRPWNRPKCMVCNIEPVTPGGKYCIKHHCINHDTNPTFNGTNLCKECYDSKKAEEDYYNNVKPLKCLSCGYISDIFGTSWFDIKCDKCGTMGNWTMDY